MGSRARFRIDWGAGNNFTDLIESNTHTDEHRVKIVEHCFGKNWTYPISQAKLKLDRRLGVWIIKGKRKAYRGKREKGARIGETGKRENGGTRSFTPILLDIQGRAYARTNGTKRSPG